MAQDWTQVPTADIEPLKAVISEMADLGYKTVQWGTHGMVISGGKGEDPVSRLTTATKVHDLQP